jgi:hyperosmotically inducible protein
MVNGHWPFRSLVPGLLYSETLMQRASRCLMRRLLSLSLVIGSLLVPAVVRAQMSDVDLAERVADGIQRYPQFGIFDDVNISVTDRNVRLTGRVTMPLKRDEIGKRVAKIDGVRSLTNDIQVLPVSRFDDDLRWRVMQAIYGHPLFWQYAQMATPPIHIIVENGHITLTGRVNSQVEKSLAFAQAHVPGSFDVKNELKIDR